MGHRHGKFVLCTFMMSIEQKVHVPASTNEFMKSYSKEQINPRLAFLSHWISDIDLQLGFLNLLVLMM